PEMGYSAFASSSTVMQEVLRFELMIKRGLSKQPQASGKEAQHEALYWPRCLGERDRRLHYQ
ncbi:hypothetical protein, partial [Neorhizobium sp. S3-V5DH]|uniref:hypothetical protein n=1 Tax=Neorhizobium sp. S3-V5DH TaxID=2485166 RepID=UPI001A9D189A